MAEFPGVLMLCINVFLYLGIILALKQYGYGLRIASK